MIRRPPRSTSMTHAVPNRRSSALPAARDEGPEQKPEPPVGAPAPDRPVSGRRWHRDLQRLRPTPLAVHIAAGPWATLAARSEEHTSEFQSLMRISYAVFCLKKKKKKDKEATIYTITYHSKNKVHIDDR